MQQANDHNCSLIYSKKTILTGSFIFFYISILYSTTLIVPSSTIPDIATALFKAKFNDTIIVLPGIYKEHIKLKPGLVLLSKELFQAVIDGKGRGDVVKLSYNSKISGFSIRNGNAGIISARHPGNSITKCKIFKNRGSGIICTGSLPKIENNIIVFNEGSGIQALDIASGVASLNHNTIAYNGNNGIIFKGKMALRIENNLICSNGSSGIKLELGNTKTLITHNNLYGNHQFKFDLPKDNFSFDPLFAAPKKRKLDFSLRSNSKAIKRGNDNHTLGAVLTME